MKKIDSLDTFGLSQNEVLYSIDQGRIVEFNKINNSIEDIIKIPFLSQIDTDNGYVEIPIVYNNVYGLRKLCIQWGCSAVLPSTNTTINLHKTFHAFYNIQVTSKTVDNVCVGVEKINARSFSIKHNGSITQNFYWVVIGQTE